MKTFIIEYEYPLDLKPCRFKVTIASWDKECAKLVFEREHPGATVIACDEKDES